MGKFDYGLIERYRNGERDFRVAFLKGADLQGANLEGAIFSGADLMGANLREAKLGATFLHGARLHNACLAGADLGLARFELATLLGADLSDANLDGASLVNANVMRADLSRASLREANLTGTMLMGSNLTGARCDQTVFGCSLEAVAGLETIVHQGPSVVDTATLFDSGGRLPEQFLRGCGLPDDVIDTAKRMAQAPADYFSCFISYTETDRELADRLYASLQDSKVRCWYSPDAIRGGKTIMSQIGEAIHAHEKVLLILSEASMKREWVKTEIREAMHEASLRSDPVLVPVRACAYEPVLAWKLLDHDTGRDLAVAIREYFMPDFSDWRNEGAFEAAFGKLLESLKRPADAKNRELKPSFLDRLQVTVRQMEADLEKAFERK